MLFLLNFVFWLSIITLGGAFFTHTKVGAGIAADVARGIGLEKLEQRIAADRSRARVEREQASQISAVRHEAERAAVSAGERKPQGQVVSSSQLVDGSSEYAYELSCKVDELQERLQERYKSRAFNLRDNDILSDRLDAMQDKLDAAEERADVMLERMKAQKERNEENIARLRNRSR